LVSIAGDQNFVITGIQGNPQCKSQKICQNVIK